MSKHKWQALSLAAAALLLWVPIGLEHKTAMIITTLILGFNVAIEFKG